MGGWLDGWAKRAAQASPAVESDVAPGAVSEAGSAPASSRRDFLKKAGIVGGIAWSVPVMQTVMAPAHAASTCQGGTSTCGFGCDNGLCPAGSGCQTNADCQFGNCAGGVCGGTGATCTTNPQCASPRTCASRTGATVCGGPGSACGTSNVNCVNNNCSGAGGPQPNTCGGKNAFCTTNAMCAAGNTCNTAAQKCQ